MTKTESNKKKRPVMKAKSASDRKKQMANKVMIKEDMGPGPGTRAGHSIFSTTDVVPMILA